MKKLPILILLTLLAFGHMAWAQSSLTLNDGTDINTRLPITGHNVDMYSKGQSIIPASELASMKWGTINKLTFYSENASASFGSAQFKVYLAEVDYTKFDSVYYNGSNLVSASSQDWNTLTEVYAGSVSVSEYKMEITLTTPFEYGVGNLLIGFYMSQPGTYASTRWLGVNQNTNTSVYELIPSFYQEGEFLPKVTISYTPTNEPCLRPILAFDNATPYEATVRWTRDDNTAWQVCLNGDEANLISVNDTCYTFTGLTTETPYSAKVRAVCGNDAYTNWSNTVQFTTDIACPAPKNLTVSDIMPPSVTLNWYGFSDSYEVQFDKVSGGSKGPVTTTFYSFEDGFGPWTQIDADGDGLVWEQYEWRKCSYYHITEDRIPTAHSGSQFVTSGDEEFRVDSYGSLIHHGYLNPDNYLVSPRIMLGGSISFYARAFSRHYSEKISLAVSTTGNTNASDFTTVKEWTVTNSNDWEEFTVDLSGYEGAGYVAIRYYKNNAECYAILVDDITITEGNTGYFECNTNSCELPVEPNTEYVARVRAKCGENDFTDWSEWLSFTTLNDNMPSGIFEINSAYDWNVFVYTVNQGHTYSNETVTLNADISVNSMVGKKDGSEYHTFNGTFDGSGHTLTVGLTSHEDWCAPFAFTYGATIKDLNVVGSVNTSGRYAGSVVGRNGTASLTLDNVTSSVAINSTYNGKAYQGGLVGYAINATLTNCVFTGKLTGSKSNYCGGLMGWKTNTDGSSVTFNNCVFAPSQVTVGSSGSKTLVVNNGTANFNNSYYTQKLGTAQGKLARSITAGEGVSVTPDNYNSCLMFRGVLYSGSEMSVPLTLGQTGPTPEGSIADSYVVNYGTLSGSSPSYTLTMPDVNVIIDLAPTEWAGEGTNVSPYLIYNRPQWNMLATRVNNGSDTYDGKFFKLMNDIYIEEMFSGDPVTMVGASESKSFRGTFDGNGHTITLSYTDNRDDSDDHYCGPFRFVNGANIKRLHVTGTIFKKDAKHVGGFIGKAYGNNTLVSCRSSVNIYSTTDGDGSHGGFLGDLRGGTTSFTDCLFDGMLQGLDTKKWGGFVGWVASGTTAEFNNCLFDPMMVFVQDDDNMDFARHDGTVTLSNSYRKYDLSGIQGVSADGMNDEQLRIALGQGWEIKDERVVPFMAAYTFEGEGTEESPFLIASEDDWNGFAGNVFLGETAPSHHFQLTNDISVTRMVGAYPDHAFKGKFHGTGHTITVNYGSSESNITTDYAAPFLYVDGGTVDGLTVDGSIYTAAQFAAGFMGCVEGTTSITNCRSSVVINSSVEGDGTHGGFVANIQDGETTIAGCVFNGSLLGSATHSCGGFIGWTNNQYSLNRANIYNSLFIPDQITVSAENGSTLVRYPSGNYFPDIRNTFYTQSMGTAQGSHAYSISGGEGVTVENANPSFTEYNVSHIISYHTGVVNFDEGIQYDDVLYSAKDQTVNLNLGFTGQGCIVNGYQSSAGTLEAFEDVYTLTMPAENVIITAAIVSISREIEGYGNSTESDHWAFIASPVNGSIEPLTVGNLLGTQIPETSLYDYDLYRLNSTTWENYHAHNDFTIVNGQGYLYATKETKTLVFTGAFNTGSSMNVTLQEGFNLVGNPFTVDAYVSKPYYTLDTDGTTIMAQSVSQTTAIEPCYGVIVQGNDNEEITFSTTAPELGTAHNNGGLNIALAQTEATRGNVESKTLDNAIVSFNEGEQLGKFYFGTQNANIYIPQQGEEYAIAFSERQGEKPLNFKANENGTYMLTITAELSTVNYLHLIDNMTGNDVDLLQTPTYTFTAKTTDYESRFKLVFIANDALADSASDAPFAFISNGNLIVNGEGTLQVIDVLGRQHYAKELSAVNCQLSAVSFPAGVYVLRLINGDDVKTQKIVVR